MNFLGTASHSFPISETSYIDGEAGANLLIAHHESYLSRHPEMEADDPKRLYVERRIQSLKEPPLDINALTASPSIQRPLLGPCFGLMRYLRASINRFRTTSDPVLTHS